MSHEAWYDAEIAPTLLVLAEKCRERGVSLVAAVEYAPGQLGRTGHLAPDADLAMVMVNHCIKMGVNIDGYIIGIGRYCKEHGIDTSASIYLHGFGDVSVAPRTYRQRQDATVVLSELPWLRGVPTVEQVAAHEKAHPSLNPIGRGGHHGGTWLCVHVGGAIGDYAGMNTLHVVQPGEETLAPPPERTDHVFCEATEPFVALANGFSFWQALADCRWAAASRFLPCTSEGIPVCLVEPTQGTP